jgi:hypothetical protein
MTDETSTAPALDPHAAAPDEDPLDHLGDEIPDPWEDDDQGDWTTQTVLLDDGTAD